MDGATTSYPTPPPGNANTVNPSPLPERDDPLQSPDRPPIPIVAQRQLLKVGAFSSPVRRSPRLSCPPPPPPPIVCQDTQDSDESSDDESEGVNDIALQLSREETPENDALQPDEPSTVLVNRIMRAHDNPSPPPQDLAHFGINYVPGKDRRFPLPGVSAPPSPFRPINFLERLNQLSDPPFDPSRSLRSPTLGDRPETSGPGIISPRGFISPESCSPSATFVPTKSAPHEDLASGDTIPSPSTQCTVEDPYSGSSQHLIITANSLDSEVLSSSPTQPVDSSLNPVVPPASDDRPQEPLPCFGRQSSSKSPPLAPNANTLSSPPSNETGEASLATETMVPGGKYNDGEEILSTSNHSVSGPRREQECRCTATSTKGVNPNSYQRLGSLSPHSADVLAGLCLPSESTSSIEQTILPVDSIPIQHPPATPSRTPRPPVTHPGSSRSTVQRLVTAPTPVRASSGARKLTSPVKFSFEVDDIYRTPAQRVPIGTARARGTSSFQRTVQKFTGSDQSQLGRFLTIRPPVFTRPALDDPSRSPAKRIPVLDLVASPARDQTSGSPLRPGVRARSASAEPRPLRPILARSRSVEPCAMISKPDNRGKRKESVFPMVSLLSRSGTKLPFPLDPSQKSTSDLPPPIPEEHETAEIGDTKTDATLGRTTQDKTISQLRHPSTNSRIPRVGNKPYARPPPKNGKATADTTTASMARAPRAPPFHLACKNNGVGNSNTEVSSTQLASDQRLVGPLKRKRGAESTAPSSSHPVMIRQVVPGILNGKYAPKPAKFPSHVQSPSESSPPKVHQPLKFRKVVDGMLSARYAPAKANIAQPGLSDSTPRTPSPLSELSLSSNEGPSDEKLPPTAHPSACLDSNTLDALRTDGDATVVETNTHERSSLYQDADGDRPSSRPRRTSRTRKPAQQQYVLDVFSGNTSTRPPPARRKTQPRMEGDGFMGMSATALKALTTSNTTKNQQIVAVLATEVIRKEGPRPESPMVKARTILQKQRDERDMRWRERAQRRAQMNEEGLGASDMEGQTELGDRVSLDHDENDYAMPPRHCWGPGDEEDYETPERPERIIEPLRLEGANTKAKPAKQVKWHQGLTTAVYLDEVDPRPKSLPKDVVVVRGCLAPTSKNLPLDPLGNLVDIDNRPSPELVTEQIVVKRYLYDNDIQPEPIPVKMTRSKSKKNKN